MPQIQIPGLPTNSGVNDSDLLHVRQGGIDVKMSTEELMDNSPTLVDLLANKSTGQIITTVVTASDPAWTPNPLTKSIKFTAVGAGGGGGGVDGVGSGANTAVSSSGGGGGTCIKTISTIDTSYNIVVGLAGVGAPAGNNDGTTGGNTTVVDNDSGTNVNLDAGGGGNGFGGSATLNEYYRIGGVGGACTGGDLNLTGNQASISRSVNTGAVDADYAALSLSGASTLGGSVSAESEVNGIDGTNFGAGGAGSASEVTSANFSGGNGAGGVVIIEEYL